MKNYSRQREAILNVLRSTTSHPTVHWIYDNVRLIIPNVSLGTVYRNLTVLVKSGDIMEVDVGDGFEHFDGNPYSHIHFHCTSCGNIFDCDIGENSLKDYVEKSLKCVVTDEKPILYGTCKNCLCDKNIKI